MSTKLIELLIAISILVAFTTSGLGNQLDYFDHLLDSDGRYFIALDVSSNGYTGKVVVKNSDLFLLLNETEGFDSTRRS